MNSIDVCVTDLSGAALDWAVAQTQVKADEITDDYQEHSTGRPYFTCKFGTPSLWGAGREQKGTFNTQTGAPWVNHGPGGDYSPSTDWRQGGPLIEKYAIGFVGQDADNWLAFSSPCDERHQSVGPTHLVAACRLIVSAEMGAVVSVPTELVRA